MPEFKQRLSKRVSKIMRKMFRSKTAHDSPNPFARTRRSLPPRERTLLTETAVWRENVEQLCREFDHRQSYGHRQDNGTMDNLRLQTRVYRDQLTDLKSEAKLLKLQRDGLWREMKDIQVRQECLRRRSVGVTPYLC